MLNIAYILTPIAGGVIGYVTNYIAIKMLFKPLTPKYVFGHQIPFTPGIIPRNRGRIAKQIGAMVANKLISKEVIVANLLTEEMTTRVRQMVSNYVESLAQSDEPLGQAVGRLIGTERVNEIVSKISNGISSMVADKVKDNATLSLGLGIGALFGLDINNEIAKTVRGLCDVPVGSVVQKMSGNNTAVVDVVMQLYKQMVEEKLPQAIESIDISRIVEDKINAMNMVEVENLILDIVKRELSAIEILGGVLGFVMGLITLIINTYAN